MAKTRKLPKRECCASKSACGRCPLRMLKEGTLPAGYTVKKRKLVRTDGKSIQPSKKGKKKSAKAA
ncbi:hypothetical protein [Nocardioides sp.]|uniref:hypothetical protein n=1 Tax=Nocardioides sp. TaxID=35761 RepID=UPI0035696C2E